MIIILGKQLISLQSAKQNRLRVLIWQKVMIHILPMRCMASVRTQDITRKEIQTQDLANILKILGIRKQDVLKTLGILMQALVNILKTLGIMRRTVKLVQNSGEIHRRSTHCIPMTQILLRKGETMHLPVLI